MLVLPRLPRSSFWRTMPRLQQAFPTGTDMPFLQRLFGLLSIIMMCTAGTAPAAAGEQPALKLGIMPFNSPLALIKTHRPLTEHLEKSLGRKVAVFTSTDYFTHINALLAGDFDLAITGPHFAAIANQRGMTPLFRYSAELNPVLVVARESSLRKPADLRGKTIAIPSRLSVTAISGIKWLQDNGLKLDRDFRTVEYHSHGAAVAAVTGGQADAAFSADSALRQMPEDVQLQLRLQPTDARTPHVTTLAHSRLGEAEIARVRAALQTFQGTPAGQRFFAETGYLGYQPVSAADLERLQAYVDITLRMMR